MAFKVEFNEEKDQILQATRGIGFVEVIKHLQAGNLLADRKNPDPAYVHNSNRRICLCRALRHRRSTRRDIFKDYLP
jgi:hypothetical protein